MDILQEGVVAEIDLLTITQKCVNDRCRKTVVQAHFYQVAHGEKSGDICVRLLAALCLDPSFEVVNVVGPYDDSPKTITPGVIQIAREIEC